LDPGEAKLAGSLDVCGYVINENRLARANLGGTHGLTVYKGVGLAGANRAGVDTLPFWEILVEIISGLKVGNVNGIGVREKDQAIAFGKLLEEAQRVDRLGIERIIPRGGELLEI